MSIQTTIRPYVRRPQFKPNDFLISQKPNEVRYLPSTLVPIEIVGDISPNRIDFHFKYSGLESPHVRKFPKEGVEITVGKYTNKVLGISLSFEPTYADLISSVDLGVTAVKKARAFLVKDSVQKSYDLIVDFLSQAKKDFGTNAKNALEDMFERHTPDASADAA